MSARNVSPKRVLLPTDFSPISSRALRHALALCLRSRTRLRVMHVIEDIYQPGESAFAGVPGLVTAETRQEVEESMRRFLAPAHEAGIDCDVDTCEGNPWRAIVATAEEMRADLVVVGTHGRGGVERLLLGSVAEKLIRSLPCSVLTVCHEEGEAGETEGVARRIICATDFSATSADAFAVALAFAEAEHSNVTLLHVVEHVQGLSEAIYRVALPEAVSLRAELDRKSFGRLKKVLAEGVGNRTDLKINARLAIGRAHQEILKIAAQQQADLIVIGAQGHGPIEHMVSGSNAQHVIRGATCPVLTVRPARAVSRLGTPRLLSRSLPVQAVA